MTSAPRGALQAGGNELGKLLAQSDGAGVRRVIEDLQRTAGNASVGGWIDTPHATALQRQTPTTKAVQRDAVIQRLSADEKAHLDDAGLIIAKAVGEMTVATKALAAYGQNAPQLLSVLRNTFNDSVNLYKQGTSVVEYTINEAREIAEAQNEVLMMVVNAATEGLTSKVKIIGRELPEGESWVGGNIESFTLEDLKKEFWHDEFLEPAREQLSKAMGEAMAPPKAPPASALAGTDELAFEKSLNQLEGQAMRFLPIATFAASLGQPIGHIDEAIQTARELGKTRQGQPVAKILTGAKAVEQLASALAAWAPAITEATKDLQDAVTVAKAIAPQNPIEAEKELWIQWASNLGNANYSALSLGGIEKHLKQLGIWDQLGVKPGMWFTDKEQAMAASMAKALRRVAAKKGTTVTFTIFSGGILPMSLPDIPYDLPARLLYDPKIGQSSWRQDIIVEAVVMGGEKLQEADTDVLSKTTPSQSYIAEYLLQHHYVGIVLKGLRNVLPEYVAPKEIK